jgi:precorrin-6A synthase
MRRIAVIGIGTGDPDHLTQQAINALKAAKVIFLTDKGDTAAELLEVRKAICERYLTPLSYRLVEFRDPERDRCSGNYLGAVNSWHASRVAAYATLIEEHLGDNDCGAFLAWGDPTLYDSILRIMHALRERESVPFDYDVIPGISSLQLLAARHRIPLNQIGEPILITTGRRLAEAISTGRPLDDDVVVMLDGDCAFLGIVDDETEIYWGAYLGMPGEILISGRLRDVADRIREVRLEARDRRGWIMDTYLLRRTMKPENLRG